MISLKNKTIIITGASRGIGREVALACAAEGANVVIAAKSDQPHPKLEGTIHSVAKEVEKAGGKGLAQ
jgi:citronellol/citronellal dehydrogenase